MTIWDEIDTIYNQAGENGDGACTFSVPGTFSGYRGHFPGNPILPGIVQLSFIRRLAERRGKRRGRGGRISFSAKRSPQRQGMPLK